MSKVIDNLKTCVNVVGMFSTVPVGAFILGVTLTAGAFYFSDTSVSNFKVSGEIEKTKTHIPNSLVGASNITCTYPQVLFVSYMNDEVRHGFPKPETNPFIFTFTDLDSEFAKLKFIDATQTISETPLIKIRDDAEKMVFIDGNGNSYITTHTIFKADGVSIYTKEASLLGIPSGSLAMGTCVDY